MTASIFNSSILRLYILYYKKKHKKDLSRLCGKYWHISCFTALFQYLCLYRVDYTSGTVC